MGPASESFNSPNQEKIMIYKIRCKEALNRLRRTLCSFGLLVSFAALPTFGQQIHELYYNGSQWTDQGLKSGEANWFSGIAGFATTPNDQLHVYYPVGGAGTIPIFINFSITERAGATGT